MENNPHIDLDKIYSDIQQWDETEERLNHLQALLDKYPALINRKHSVHKTPLISWGIQAGKIKFVKKLIQNNAELNYEKITEANSHSSLGYAAMSGNLPTIKFIFNKLKLLLINSQLAEETKHYLEITLQLTEILYMKQNLQKQIEAKLEELMQSTIDEHKELLISAIIDIVPNQNKNFIAIWKKTIRYFSKSYPGLLCLLHSNFAQGLIQLNQLTAAEEHLNKAILQLKFITDEDKQNKCKQFLKRTFNELGTQHFNQKAYKQSISCYQNAIAYCLLSDIDSLYLLHINYAGPFIQLNMLVEAEMQLNTAASFLKNVTPEDKKNKFSQFLSPIYYELADGYCIQKKYDRAMHCYRNALAHCLSSDPDYLYNLHISSAEACIQLNQLTEAEIHLNTAISQLNFFTNEDKKNKYRQSLKDMFNTVGTMYFEQQAYAQAIVCYKNAIDYCHASDIDSLCTFHINYAQASLELNNLSQTKKHLSMAASIFKAITHKDKKNELKQSLKELFYELGEKHFLQQAYDQAIDNYKKALSYCSPSDADSLCILHANCAKTFIKLNQLTEARNYLSNAESAFKIMTKEDEKNSNREALVRIFNGMGIIYFNQQKYDQAIQCYKNALTYCLPSNADWLYSLHINYAQALIELNQLSETEAHLNTAISQLEVISKQVKKERKYKENLFNILFTLHTKYLKNQKYDKAISYFDQAMSYCSSPNKKKLLPLRSNLLQAMRSSSTHKQRVYSHQFSSSQSSSSTQFFVPPTENKNLATHAPDKKLSDTATYIFKKRTELILRISSKDKNDTSAELYKNYLELISCDEKSATLDIALETANLTLERFFKTTLDLLTVINKIKEFLQHKKIGFSEQALAYYQDKRYSISLIYWQIAEKYFHDKIKTPLELATLYSNMASCYRELQKYNDAIDYCQKALEIRKRHTSNVDLIKKTEEKLDQIIQLEQRQLSLANTKMNL